MHCTGMVVVLLPLMLIGCPSERGSEKRVVSTNTPQTEAKPNPNSLPADTKWHTGTVPGISLTLRDRVRVGNTALHGEETRDLFLTDSRATIVLRSTESYMPPNTELRYSTPHRAYTLSDPKTKQYWRMTGARLAALLEGGVSTKRTGYSLSLVPKTDIRTISGFRCQHLVANIRFVAETNSVKKPSKSNVHITLDIWHSADKRLLTSWADTLIDLLTMPMQDDQGHPIVQKLKNAVAFPLEFTMSVDHDGALGSGSPPHFQTSVQRAEIGSIQRVQLSWPPVGYTPATSPYSLPAKNSLVGPDTLRTLQPQAASERRNRRTTPGP